MASTRNFEALWSAVASTLPTSRSSWTMGARETPASRGLRLVHLQHVLEPEQIESPVAIVDQAVERRQQGSASLEGLSERFGVHAPGPGTPSSGRLANLARHPTARSGRRSPSRGRCRATATGARFFRRRASPTGTTGASGGYTRSARSHTRCRPRRPAIATSPRIVRISSIWVILRCWSSPSTARHRRRCPGCRGTGAAPRRLAALGCRPKPVVLRSQVRALVAGGQAAISARESRGRSWAAPSR